MNLADTGGSTPRSEWIAPPSWWAGTDPAGRDQGADHNSRDDDGGSGGSGNHHHHQQEQEQEELSSQASNNNGHRQNVSTSSASLFEPENRPRVRGAPQQRPGVPVGRNPRSMFGDLPNSSFDTDLLGDPVRRELDQREAAAAAAAAAVDPALPHAERRSLSGAAIPRTSEDPPPQRARLSGNNDEFWRRECSRLQDQLESLTKERDRWEQDRRRLVSDDVDRARDLVGLKRAVEAQSQLVMESLVVAQRIATAGSSALSERAAPQGLLLHNARAQSNARHGSTTPPDDDPKALGGPLLLETFAQRRQQIYADRRPQMDVVARYSRGGASRRRYRESGQQASRQAGATRQLQKEATGGENAPRDWDFPRSSGTGHMPLAGAAPRNLRMFSYDRGRKSGWRRIADGGSGGYGKGGDGGSGSGSGGDGRRKVWEWNGRRVVLQVFPTETTPPTLETPTPAAEPDEGESRSATETPQTKSAAAAAAAAEATAQIVSTSLLNEVKKIKAAVRDLAGAVDARPLPRGDVEETAPLTPDEPTAATPSVTASHQPRPPGAEYKRSDETKLELGASPSRRASSSSPTPVPLVSSSTSAPASTVKGSDDTKSSPNLITQSLSFGGETNRGAAANPDGMPLADKLSGNNDAGGEREAGAGVLGTASPRGPRPSIEEELAEETRSSAREKVARSPPSARATPSIDADPDSALFEHSGSSSNVRRSSSSSPPALAQVPDSLEPAAEQQQGL